MPIIIRRDNNLFVYIKKHKHKLYRSISIIAAIMITDDFFKNIRFIVRLFLYKHEYQIVQQHCNCTTKKSYVFIYSRT